MIFFFFHRHTVQRHFHTGCRRRYMSLHSIVITLKNLFSSSSSFFLSPDTSASSTFLLLYYNERWSLPYIFVPPKENEYFGCCMHVLMCAAIKRADLYMYRLYMHCIEMIIRMLQREREREKASGNIRSGFSGCRPYIYSIIYPLIIINSSRDFSM